jgi:hypothetical protein
VTAASLLWPLSSREMTPLSTSAPLWRSMGQLFILPEVSRVSQKPLPLSCGKSERPCSGNTSPLFIRFCGLGRNAAEQISRAPKPPPLMIGCSTCLLLSGRLDLAGFILTLPTKRLSAMA